MRDKLQIAVFGSDEDHCNKNAEKIAEEVGREIAKTGNIIVNGGLGGVMLYSARGAKENGGKVVGVLPSNRKNDANPYCDIIIPTGVGYMRGHMIANSADSAIVINGGIGTRQESESAYWNFVPIVSLENSGGTAQGIAGNYLDERCLTKAIAVQTPQEAVKRAVELGKNRVALERRLKEAGLDLDIYRKKPNKFVRINPRNPINIEELKTELENKYGVVTGFISTGIGGIYESTNPNIGGEIDGKRNVLFNERYFIQDLASVICVEELGLREGCSLLETCAARGFKSILAHDSMGGKIDITALDIDKDKYEVMLRFFKKFGINARTKLTDASRFKGAKHDYVLVDAPCSSEGMNIVYDSELKRDVSGFDSAVSYSPADIKRLASLQGKLLQNGFNHLKDDGTLIYATCTLNKQENEEVVRRFLENNPEARVIKVDMDRYGVKNMQSDLGVRILPDRTKGFYFAKIKMS